tara:strand:+ start:806 stop:1282 length:477 start_codon:yes stop_codon:yes gene_type:complete
VIPTNARGAPATERAPSSLATHRSRAAPQIIDESTVKHRVHPRDARASARVAVCLSLARERIPFPVGRRVPARRTGDAMDNATRRARRRQTTLRPDARARKRSNANPRARRAVRGARRGEGDDDGGRDVDDEASRGDRWWKTGRDVARERGLARWKRG